MELDLAIAGATSLVGEAILALLEDMDFPIGQLYLLVTRSVHRPGSASGS